MFENACNKCIEVRVLHGATAEHRPSTKTPQPVCALLLREAPGKIRDWGILSKLRFYLLG